jgi:cytochrome c-type biogenesis protein CcmH/NrfG
LKAQGNTSEAIKELNTYLDTYMADHEAWKELTDLYLSQQMYSMAAHCLEELILLSPHNHLTYLKYAMTLYTMGGNENLTLARAYFCKVLDLNKDNTRALIGLKLASS